MNKSLSTQFPRYMLANGVDSTLYSHVTLTGVALGYGAIVSYNSVAIGANATASGLYGVVALGNNAKSSSHYAIAIGQNSNATSSYAVAIGHISCSSASATAIGYNAWATGSTSVAIGASSRATATSAVAIGYNAISNLATYIQLGSRVNTEFARLNVGAYELFNASNGMINSSRYVGASSATNTTMGTIYGNTTTLKAALGYGTIYGNTGSLALGVQANSSGDDGIAVGCLSRVGGNQGISIGSVAVSTGINAIAIGANTSASALNSVSIGHLSNATATGMIRLGGSPHQTLYFKQYQIMNSTGALYITNSSGSNAWKVYTDASGSLVFTK